MNLSTQRESHDAADAARKGFHVNTLRSQEKRSARRLQWSLNLLFHRDVFLVAFLALFFASSAYAAPPANVAATFIYDSATPAGTTPWETTPEQAFVDAQAGWNYGTCPSSCRYITNLQPDTTGTYAILYNGSVYYRHYYDVVYCGGGTCTTVSQGGNIQAVYQCPAIGFAPEQLEQSPDPNVPRQITSVCVPTYPPDVIPCPICTNSSAAAPSTPAHRGVCGPALVGPDPDKIAQA